MPNFAFDGQLLLADRSHIARSPDGHGGCIPTLTRNGALADMQRRGIGHISYWRVHNPLVRLFNPLFLGLRTLDAADISSPAVVKNSPWEKVGNSCLTDRSPDCTIEIAPSFALEPADVAARRDEIPPIRPGDEIYLAQTIRVTSSRICGWSDW